MNPRRTHEDFLSTTGEWDKIDINKRNNVIFPVEVLIDKAFKNN